MRTYERTHPWLTFSADLRRAPTSLWLMLGECQAKCEHIAGVPLMPATADRLYRLYLARGVLATTAIEGNTLSEEEVLSHLEGELELPPSREYLSREIDNIVSACEGIRESIAAGTVPEITPEAICRVNRTVLEGLDLDDDVAPGRIRRHAVTVGRYKAAPAGDCCHLLEKLCLWLNGEDFAAPTDGAIAGAILKAVMAHLYIAWIHPFGDGNGRTARVLEFQILISSGVSGASAHLLSTHYNLTRTEYYRQLDRASGSKGHIIPFIVYAVQGFRDGLRQQANVIREQQRDIAWRNYVHEFFADKRSASAVRQRYLALDLSRQEQLVPLSGLPEISPRLARTYATKSRRTLIRDLNVLLEAGLVVRAEDGYHAHRELMLAFLPERAADDKGGATHP